MQVKVDLSHDRWIRHLVSGLMVLGLAIPLISHATSVEAAGLGPALAAHPDGYPAGGADDPPDEPDLPDDNGVDPPDAPDAPDDGPHQGNGR